jgi:radical SAM superfamily enzyme YgiQ (UPF0313 family)
MPTKELIILTADESNFIDYHLSFLTGFISCFPKRKAPFLLRKYLERKIFGKVPADNNGIAKLALLPLRRIEASLVEAGMKVKVVVPSKLENFENVKVIGISVMDPLGLGPATTTFSGLLSDFTSYNKFYFRKLIEKIHKINPSIKIIVGGPGTWELELKKHVIDELGIDCVVIGEGERIAPSLFKKALKGDTLPKIVYGKSVQVRNIPKIKGPCYWEMTEIGRGCDRKCTFCEPTWHSFRWFPIKKITEDVKVNLSASNMITLHAEDVFRYGCRPGEWVPNWKIIKLVKEVKKYTPNINITHGCLSSPAATPNLIKEFGEVLATSQRPIGVQVGLETGSIRLMERYMRGKCKPFSPKEWHAIVEKAFDVLTSNNIIPAATLVVGLKDEREDDIINTIELVEKLRQYPSLIIPLFFVPLGILKKEEFFLKKMLTDSHTELFIKCAEHSIHWGRYFSGKWESTEFITRFLFNIRTLVAFRGLSHLRSREKVGRFTLIGWILSESLRFLGSEIKKIF